MNIVDAYKNEYKQLRTRLFKLKLKQELQSKTENEETFYTTKKEIDEVKKAIGKIVRLSKTDENNAKKGKSK